MIAENDLLRRFQQTVSREGQCDCLPLLHDDVRGPGDAGNHLPSRLLLLQLRYSDGGPPYGGHQTNHLKLNLLKRVSSTLYDTIVKIDDLLNIFYLVIKTICQEILYKLQIIIILTS